MGRSAWCRHDSKQTSEDGIGKRLLRTDVQTEDIAILSCTKISTHTFILFDVLGFSGKRFYLNSCVTLLSFGSDLQKKAKHSRFFTILLRDSENIACCTWFPGIWV